MSKLFLQATQRARLDVGYSDRPVIIGIAQIVTIRPARKGETGCEVQTTGDKFIDLVETFDEIAAAIGGLPIKPTETT